MNIPSAFVRGFIFLFTSFYYLFMKGDKYQIFFTFLLMGIYLYSQSTFFLEDKIKEQKTSKELWREVQDDLRKFTLHIEDVYSLHKPPDKLKYIFMNPVLTRILEDLYFLRIYNNETYMQTVIGLEYFMKLHYNIMIDKYDACQYFPIVRDIRRNVLNFLSSITLNTSSVSRVVDIPNIDTFVEKRIRDIQGITNKYINVLRHKYKEKCPHLLDVDIQHYSPGWNNFDLYV